MRQRTVELYMYDPYFLTFFKEIEMGSRLPGRASLGRCLNCRRGRTVRKGKEIETGGEMGVGTVRKFVKANIRS